MYAIWIMALRNLQRRILQSLLVGIVIGLSVLIFFSGFGLIREISGPFEQMVEEQRASQLSLRFDTRVHNPEHVIDWWQQRSEVESVTPPMAFRELEGSSFHSGTELNSLLAISERPRVALAQDHIKAIEGDILSPPGPGEVWIPTSIANETGLSIGGILEIPAYAGLAPLKVTAVVVDPQYGAPFNNPKRIWIGPGQMPYLFQVGELSTVNLGIRLNNVDDLGPLWDQFVADMGGAFAGQKFDYQAMQVGFMAPYNLMGAMLIAFSVLSILIALFAIHGTITSAILADFRTIGILRAQGFRPGDVRNIYRIQYLVMALVAVPIGVVVGIPLVRQGVTLLMSSTGIAAEGSSLVLIAMITALIFLALVWLFVGRIAKRAEAVQPSEAIRFGGSSNESATQSGPSMIAMSRFGVPFAVAVKNLLLQRRRTLLLTVSVVFATVAGCLAVNLDHSFQMGRKDPSLLGFDSADVRIIRGGKRFGIRHDTMMNLLREHPDVQSIATSDFVSGKLLLDNNRSVDQTGFLVAGDTEALSYRTLEGRNPQTDDEVAVGINTAKRHGLGVGDIYSLFIGGQRLDLEITGIFQSLNNGGTGFRIGLDTMRKADPMYEPVRYGIALREGVDAQAFIESMEGQYGEAMDAQPGDHFVRGILDMVIDQMRVMNTFLASIFLLAASVFIFNSTLMSVAENRRVFGILKTVGMTPAQLRTSVVIGVGIIACVGIALGLVVWTVGAPMGLSLLFSGLGLVSFPLQNSLLGMASLVPLVLGFCLLGGWIPSARLLELDPRGLIVE